MVRTVERTFNRFHLLTEEKTTQQQSVKRVKTEYYAKDVPFEQQVAQFQLPQKITTSWELTNDATQYRAEVTLSAYDEHGNQTEQVEPNGIKTTYTYYPKAGEPGFCPPDRFVRNLKDTLITPSPDGEPGAAPVRTRLRYGAYKPLTGSNLQDWLAVESETQDQLEGSNAITLQHTERTYYDLPGDAFQHGRPATEQTTLKGKTSTRSYEYELLNSQLAGERVLQTTETFKGFDDAPGKDVRKTIVSEDSLLHGQPLLTQDDNEVRIRNTYDSLIRVVSETVSPGEPDFEATRNYEYFLTSLDGQQASQVVTDVKGVKTRSFVDGLNRPVYEERHDADNPQRAGEFRQTWSARYDVSDNLVEETQYDWRGSQEVALTSQFEYDDWGMQRCVTGPDGVKVYEQTNPLGSSTWKGPIQSSWREGGSLVSGKVVTYLNLFEKPDRVERFETGAVFVSKHQYRYDGLGRTVEEIDANDASTQYAYDAFGRLTTNVLPLGATVVRRYAEHSPDDLPTHISVDGKVLGEQVYDGLDRMTESVTGGRRQLFSYNPGQSQPATVTTASGQVVNYDYQPQLGEEPSLRRLPEKEPAEYVRDGKNARLVMCKEDGLELQRQYFSTGELKSEARKQDDRTDTMHYDYSRLGLLLKYVDVLGQTQSYTYDTAGRLELTRLGTTSSQFKYDDLGQLCTINTEDSATLQHVTINLEYDGLGRETKRCFDLNDVKQELVQAYNEVDLLVSRTLREGQTLLRHETYQYDARGRLFLYECEGSQSPVDPYGMVIISQLFRFDVLNNLTRVTTTYQGPGGTRSTNNAVYTYTGIDPVQLSTVTNSATGDGYPAIIELEYDADGHMIRDEEGRLLDYDALGRLIKVSALPGETPSGYRYDPLDTLSGRDSGTGQEQRFYQNGELANQIRGANSSTFMRGDGVVLAEHQAGADPKSLLLIGDHKNTLVMEASNGVVNSVAHTAYGHPSAQQPIKAQLRYNGEFSEPQTGWQLLGNGYRAYNFTLMRFQSPDSWSPFGSGGVNAYAYSEGEPVMNVDPQRQVFASVPTPYMNHRFQRLRPDTRYFIEVRATSSTGESEPSVSSASTRTFQAPQGLSVNEVTDDSALLRWNSGADDSQETQYEVDLDNQRLATLPEKNYRLTGLTEQTEYEVKVRAKGVGNYGLGDYFSGYTSQRFKTLAFTGIRICPPGNVRGTRNGANSAVLSWDEPYATCNLCPNAVGYEISGAGITTINVTRPPWAITGLSADHAYRFAVRARATANNISQPAELLIGAQPGTPVALQVAGVTGTRATLVWTAPGGTVVVYDYSITCNGVLVGTPRGLDYALSPLQPGSTYTVEVRARSVDGGHSAPATATFITVDPSNVPRNLRVTANQNRTVSIAWEAPTGQPPVGYRVSVLSNPTDVTATAHTMHNMIPLLPLNIAVCCRFAGGELSDWVYVQVLPKA